MKKRAVILLLVLVLLVQAVPVSAVGVTMVAVDDVVLGVGVSMPVSSGGVTYVPASLLGYAGISSNIDSAGGVTSLSSGSYTVYFDMISFFSYDSRGNFYETGVYMSGSTPYYPLDFVCSLFGMSYGWNSIEYGTLFRLRSSSVLNDTQFISAAQPVIREVYRKYTGDTGITTPENPPPVVEPDPQPPEDDNEDEREETVRLSATLYLVGPLSDETGNILDALEEQGVTAAFFTDADSVRAYPDIVRRIYCSGYVLGADATELEEAEEFNDALDQVLLVRSRMVYSGGEDTARLEAAGYIVYTATCATAPSESGTVMAAAVREVESMRNLRSITVSMETQLLTAADLRVFIQQVENCGWYRLKSY